jgi:ribonuclease R
LNRRRSKFGPRERGRGTEGAGGAKHVRGIRGGHPAARPARNEKRATQESARRDSLQVRPGNVVEGTVSAHRAGYGFLRVEGMSDSVFIPPREMRGLMHGDRARVRVSRDASDRWLGEVQEITGRGVNAFLGTVEIQGKSAWVNAVDRRLQLRCSVSLNDLGNARNNDWVIARITRHAKENAPPQARVLKRLDPDRPVELSTESAIARFELPHEFSAAALREAAAFGDKVDPSEIANRADIRNLPLVTIDGDNAKDFDDAVYAERHAAGYRVIVAIADVSHYVRPGTALDAGAVERGTSVYFPTRVVPMLPHALSDHLCSLAPKVDRLCLVADMIVTKQGALKSSTFYPATMRSHARLTYTLANEAVFEGKAAAREARSSSTPPRPSSSSTARSGCAQSSCGFATMRTS